MSYLLKDIYSETFFNTFSEILGQVIPGFSKETFIRRIFEESWPEKELKERMYHTSFVLKSVLSEDFQQAAAQIEAIINLLRSNGIRENTIEFMFLPDFIEKYGINDFDTSVKTIEMLTQFTSCEYAVRPFIIKYGDKMIQQMLRWSNHENHHVRRLSSEGSRPRLPWAMALPELKKNPAPVLPILENLKNDPSEYVRRSVANSLNDISKDNPEIVIQIAKQWHGNNPETNAIIKHACRTLLKQGNPEMLALYDLTDNPLIVVKDFRILTPVVKTGDYLIFSFTLINTDTQIQAVRLEYGIYYLRQNGQHSRKVFKITEKQMQPNEKTEATYKQSFRIITTRQFYTGQQKLSIILNGQEREIADFELIVNQ